MYSFLFMFTAGKIIGWFRNQRTAVGKVYKHKSGQATETLTQRKAWQVKAFAFLKEHISPRSYTVESTVVSIEFMKDIYVITTTKKRLDTHLQFCRKVRRPPHSVSCSAPFSVHHLFIIDCIDVVRMFDRYCKCTAHFSHSFSVN